MERLVEVADPLDELAAEEHRGLADETRLLEPRHAERLGRIALQDRPRLFHVIAFPVDGRGLRVFLEAGHRPLHRVRQVGVVRVQIGEDRSPRAPPSLVDRVRLAAIRFRHPAEAIPVLVQDLDRAVGRAAGRSIASLRFGTWGST